MAAAVPSQESVRPETELQPCDSFRTPDACRLTGATYRQLDYWARIGIIGPSIADAAGSGSARLWAYEDVVAAALVVALLVAGQTLQSARRFVARLRVAPQVDELREQPWQSVAIVVDVSDVRRVVGERLTALRGAS